MPPQPEIHLGRYIDPLSDFGFKLLFGSEPNKDLLISFLNGLFYGKKTVVDILYQNNEQPGPQPRFRKSIFDLVCTDLDGTQFIIEVQRIYQHFFKDRAIYYTSTLIHNQGPKGKSKWDFRLQEVYFIALMDFAFEDSDTERYMHVIRLADEETGKVFYEKLGYIFIEIPKFNIAEKDLKTDFDCWLYVLKNMSRLDKIPVFLDKRIFKKLFNISEISKLKEEEYMQYKKSMMATWDEYAILKTAEEKGIEKGRLETEERKNAEFVQSLIEKMGLSDTQIAHIAGVDVAFVANVRKTLSK